MNHTLLILISVTTITAAEQQSESAKGAPSRSSRQKGVKVPAMKTKIAE